MNQAPGTDMVPLEDLDGGGAVDKRLVDEAVRAINLLYAAGSIQTYRSIGMQLLKTFFDGDWEAFRFHGRKHASLRALARHPGLKFSPSHLWFCVAIAWQFEQLPKELAEALNFSEHKLLLPVRDLAQKESLAKKAVREELTVLELKQEVDRALGRRNSRPRRAEADKFAFLKGLDLVAKGAEALKDEPILVTDEDMSTAELRGLLRRLEANLKVLEGVRGELEAVAG